MIAVEGLDVRYGSERALENIHLSVPGNTTCAVVGPSGCGKTTLLHVLAGLIAPDGGRVRIDGKILKGNRNGTGVVFQNYGLFPWKTVWENIALGLVVRKMERAAIARIVHEVMDDLGIVHLWDRYPVQLSGGEKQRVSIGRALALSPDLLLLDEPSSALDANTREDIQNLLLKIFNKRSLVMLVVTHSIEEAVFLGGRIVIMEKAGIRRVVDNPLFGDADSREHQEFYRSCISIRQMMDGR